MNLNLNLYNKETYRTARVWYVSLITVFYAGYAAVFDYISTV